MTPSYDEVKEHRKQLISAINKYLESTLSKKCFVGYVWKLEYGLRKSWHYHFLLILNGQEVRQDIVIATKVGLLWEEITKGKGIFYNCNQVKHKYKKPGVGLIGHRDSQLREGLDYVIAYLTKTDMYIRLVVPGNGRAFGKAVAPRKTSKRKGRPRQSDKMVKRVSYAHKPLLSQHPQTAIWKAYG